MLANKDYDARKSTLHIPRDFAITSEYGVNHQNPKDVYLRMIVKQDVSADSNLPYSWSVEILGTFNVLVEGSDEDLARLVTVNGNSMLYGILREVIRSLTAQGPYKAEMLPSVSFFNRDQSQNKATVQSQPVSV